jgi:hypothetical protein
MSLVDILSLDGLKQLSLTLTSAVQDHIWKLRSVSRQIKLALESNISLQINIRLNNAGEEGITAYFLQRWRGGVHLHCTRPWGPGSRWFAEVRDALAVGRLRLLILSVTVQGNNLHPLVKSLVEIGPAIQQLEITYRGKGTDLSAAGASLASLSHALTMKINFEGRDRGGSRACAWLRHLHALKIGINYISLRSVHPVSPCRTTAPTAPVPFSSEIMTATTRLLLQSQ